MMTELWSNFTHEGSLESGFQSSPHAEAEDLAFLGYGTVTQEQCADMDEFGSFGSVDAPTPSDLSEEGTDHELRSDLKHLALEVKILKETYV